MGIFLDTCAFCTSIYNEAVLTVSLGIYRYKNDFKSDFPFPRIIAMQGDGKTSYDIARDGVPNMIGECTVRADVYGILLRFQQTVQAGYRGANVATKLKVIYVKDTLLDVRQPLPLLMRISRSVRPCR